MDKKSMEHDERVKVAKEIVDLLAKRGATYWDAECILEDVNAVMKYQFVQSEK